MKEASHIKAYSEGYFAAIYRQPRDKNPHEKDAKELSDAWLLGHTKGMKIVQLHTTNLGQRANTAWFGNYRE